MNGHKTERSTQSRRGAIPGIAACRDGVARLQIANRASNQAADRHSHAIERRQCQQWATTGLMALFVRGSGVDIQGPIKTRPGRPTGARADLLHEARGVSQEHELVCRHMGTATSPSGYGLRASVAAAWRVCPVASANYTFLYGKRTYEALHRNGNRTRGRNHRNGNRTYGACFCTSLGTETVHHLDMPICRAFAGDMSKGVNRHRWPFWLTNSGAKL